MSRYKHAYYSFGGVVCAFLLLLDFVGERSDLDWFFGFDFYCIYILAKLTLNGF